MNRCFILYDLWLLNCLYSGVYSFSSILLRIQDAHTPKRFIRLFIYYERGMSNTCRYCPRVVKSNLCMSISLREVLSSISAIASKIALEFWISIIATCSAMLRLVRDKQVMNGEGNLSTRRKPLSNSKSLATFSHGPVGIRTRQWGNTASSQWRRLRSLDHQSKKSFGIE